MEEEAGVARGQGDEINVLHDVSINDAIETGGMLLTQDFPTSPDSSTATDSKKENLPALPQATIASTDDDDDGGSVNEISTQCEPAVVVVAESPPSTTSHATLKQNPEHSESPVPEPPVLAPALAIDQTALTSPPIAKDKDETADTSCDDEDESSSSEDDDDEPNDRNVLSLMDRRKRNMERNQAFLNRIGLAYGITSKRKRTLTKKSTAQDDDDDSTAVVVKKRRGMLLLPTPTAFNSSSNPIPATSQNSGFVESLLTTFPHRQPQIRKLSSLLTAAAAQSCPATAVASTCSETPIVHTIVHVPAPILVTGANGSGKTCILRAIVNGILQQQEQQHGSASKVVSAYTNCATLDVPSIDELVTSAFNQFQAAVERLSGDKNASTKLKRRKKKRLAGDASSRGLESSEAVERATPEACDNMADKAVENSAGPEKRASRHRSAARTTRRNKASETTAEAPTFKAAKTRVFSAGSEDMAVVSSETTWSTEQTAVWAFGRTLASLFEGRRHAGILVVDQAERLQSMSTNKGTGERNNFLSQLLFLPRVANINLTVIVVSNSLLLDHSRLNNLVPAQRSLGSISADLQPIRVHFSAYKGKVAIKEILHRRNVQQLITGEATNFRSAGFDTTAFKATVFRSFLDTLVQSIHDLTSDVNEFVRLGRLIWPKYTEPLCRDNIDSTVESARKALLSKGDSNASRDLVQREILTVLDRKIFPEVRRVLQQGMFTLDFDSPSCKARETDPARREQHEMPQLTKYLLLAAFICQHNRPDRDKHLFSIQKNGRRRRSSNGENNNVEEVAFGSSSQNQQPKKLRPRSFPLERMLSVYVSMIGLNQSLIADSGGDDERLRSLGTCTFNDSLAHLRDIGFLQEPPSRSTADAMRTNDARYCCSLTLDEAQGIAKSLHFPIDRYIL